MLNMLMKLRYFRTVYEQTSIRKAAKHLYISPQGLSNTIQNLEKELNVILFMRDTLGLVPTSAGEFLYRRSERIIRELETLASDLQDISSAAQEIHLSCSYGVLNALPFTLLTNFETKNPDIKLRWKECPDNEVYHRVLTGEADIGIGIVNKEELALTYIPLFSKKIVLLVYEGHPLWNNEQIKWKDLSGERLITEGSDFYIYRQLWKKCHDQGFLPNIVAQTAEISLTHKLCLLKAGLGITIDFLADEFTHLHSSIKAIPFADDTFLWNVAIIQKNSHENSPAVQSLEAYLIKAFSNTL